MISLGISAFYHDSAAAIAENGQLLAAAQEERFSRVKHDPGFPIKAVLFCLSRAGRRLSELDHVVFYDKPFLKFERLLETYVATAPFGFRSFMTAMPVWMTEKLFLKRLIKDQLLAIDAQFDWKTRLFFTEHHIAHAASAFFPSPFDEAAFLTLDGVGEWATTSMGIGKSNHLEIQKELHFPHSLGLLYSAFTYYTGFKVNSGEYKLMGLAPYGEPKYESLIRDHLVDIKSDGTFRLDLSYFDFLTGLRMINDKFAKLFGEPVKREQEPIRQFHMDIAASIQSVTTSVVLALARSVKRETDMTNLCMAGGVALNCVANGALQRANVFENIWIQPAAGDAGGAIGAALAGSYIFGDLPRYHCETDGMQGSYLGPEFSEDDTIKQLQNTGAVFSVMDDDELFASIAAALADNKAVGWMQGRMEFGPRALGNRSILGDPRSPTMQKTLNLKVKFRESFRPFAPSVLDEDASAWFDLDCPSPYMLLVADVLPEHRVPADRDVSGLFGIDQLNVCRSTVPAITHVDYSARVQTVSRSTNERYHRLISTFKEKTGVGMLVNTSFNVKNEPVICSPTDAFRCFMGSNIDILVVGNCVMHKTDQDAALRREYWREMEAD